MKPLIHAFIGIAMLFAACGTNPEAKQGESGALPSTQRKISRENFHGTWPFTIDSAVVRCVQYDANGVNPQLMRGVVIEADRVTYALNGTAKSHAQMYGYHPIEEIWAIDTAMTNLSTRTGFGASVRVDIGDVTKLGLSLCK